MFVFGSDGGTLRAWPLHAIKSLTFNPRGSGPAAGGPELAVHLADGTVAWLRGAEAEAVWRRITSEGYGLAPGP
jgi:hypothetical protein